MESGQVMEKHRVSFVWYLDKGTFNEYENDDGESIFYHSPTQVGAMVDRENACIIWEFEVPSKIHAYRLYNLLQAVARLDMPLMNEDWRMYFDGEPILEE
jgi:hypothetical protein